MSRKKLIVMKFGGTSVGDASRFRQCAQIVSKAAQNDRIIVVVSAMAGITDLIFKIITAARHGDSTTTETNLNEFEERHRELVRELFSAAEQYKAFGFVERVLDQLRESSKALITLRTEISPQTMDSLVALGEQISAWALAHYLERSGCAAECIPAEKVFCCHCWNAGRLQWLAATAEPLRTATPRRWDAEDQTTRQPLSGPRQEQMKFGSGRTWMEYSRRTRASVRTQPCWLKSALPKLLNWRTTEPR
jgi:aspartokinase